LNLLLTVENDERVRANESACSHHVRCVVDVLSEGIENALELQSGRPDDCKQH